MRNKLYFIAPVLLLLLLCGSIACERKLSQATLEDPTLNAQFYGPQVERDLDKIRESGKLKAIAIYNSTSYFLYRGQPMGFEYEMLSHLAADLDLQLEIVVARNVNEVFDLLNKGEGDIIAWGLTITEPRKKIVSFTDYYYLTHQTLVQRRPENWRRLPKYKIDRQLVGDVVELIGDTVAVPRYSSYYQRMLNVQQEIGGTIILDTNVGGANTDDLIDQVVKGEIKYTVADYNLAAINQCYNPILDIETPVSFSQRIAWAVRKNSPELLKAVNGWINKFRKKDLYYILYNKYFENKKSYQRRVKSEFYSRKSGKISPYDSLLKAQSADLGWNWRLLASVVYQESRFDPRAKSWVGAQGLMQMMPATAREMGVQNPLDPAQSLAGGIRYLDNLYGKFEKVEDSIQRIKFALAAYNCGLGHVRDAQRLARKFGENPHHWDGATELYLRQLNSAEYYQDPVVRYGYVRGEEPYNYVRDIFLRYQHYRRLLPPDDFNAPEDTMAGYLAQRE